MPNSLTGRAFVLAAFLWTGGLLLAGPASALINKPVWKCRASAGYTTVNGGDRAEPVVANGNVNTAHGEDPDRALCASGEAGGGNLPAPLGIPGNLLAASSASANTTVGPELGPSSAQRVGALGRVEALTLRLPQGGTVALGATVAEATATGACVGGAPQLAGHTRVSGLTLNGAPVQTSMLASDLTAALSTLDPLVSVKQDEMIRTADGLSVRALHIVVRLTSGIIDTVVAEAKAGFDGAVCAAVPPVVRTADLCPRGSMYDAARNLCILAAGSAHNSGPVDIVLGSPRDSPPAGEAWALADARRRYGNSPCLSGSGSKYAIVGTNRSDDLPGTKRDDRIIARGGNDRIYATRGNDCIDGGSGGDTLSGDLGNDRIYGGRGNDKINGGPGNDTIAGGPGDDTINAAFGADRIEGGTGRDYINIATAGPAASANCGGGRDKIRFNQRERKRVHACETRYKLND